MSCLDNNNANTGVDSDIGDLDDDDKEAAVETVHNQVTK
jgi:hypothetical protein